MTVKVSVKARFVYNGKEYGSLEELPEDVREAYRVATAGSRSGVPAARGSRSKIVFNGVEYESVDAMPAEERRMYESALAMARSGHLAPVSGAGGSGGAATAGIGGQPAHVVTAAPIEPGSGAGRRAPVALVLGLLLLLMLLGLYLYTVAGAR